MVGILALLILSGGTARASQDPYRDQAEKISCPAAPPGWFNPSESAGGRTFLTPLTPIVQPDGPTEFFGAPVVEVDCRYMTAAGKNLAVLVRYALPIDINPWNDFYIGCTVTGHPQNLATGARAWNERDRIYRVVGAKTWSLATFIDDLRAAPARRRAALRGDRRTRCSPPPSRSRTTASSPGTEGRSASKSIWTFSFDAHTSGGGVTSSGEDDRVLRHDREHARRLGRDDQQPPCRQLPPQGGVAREQVVARAPRRSADRLSPRIRIASYRRESSCSPRTRAGAERAPRGRCILSVQYLTAPRVAVTVCGRTYLDGKGQVSAQMKTV